MILKILDKKKKQQNQKLSAIKRNAGSIKNKWMRIEIYIRKCKNKKMREKLEEKALLATIDIKGLEPKLGSDGFLAVNAAFQIEPYFDNSVN